jgi:hypothetical protein
MRQIGGAYGGKAINQRFPNALIDTRKQRMMPNVFSKLRNKTDECRGYLCCIQDLSLHGDL